jgi:hypothetical protein
MHGLTGGSWKRSTGQAKVAEKNNPGGKPRGNQWLHDLPLIHATAPAPDPPVAGGWQVGPDTPTSVR